MLVFISIIIILLFVVLIMLLSALSSFDRNVATLLTHSKPLNKRFLLAEIAHLPKPVKSYFNHVLTDGQPYISYLQIKHKGRFKTGIDKAWESIEGVEYFTVEKPGFVWKGRTKNFTALDQYVNRKGNLKVFLFFFLPVVNGNGNEFSQGELLRWLGECVWFPTALLPNENLNWEPIDDYTAKLVYRHKDVLVYYMVTFNEAHEIIQLMTQRYMGNNELETWVGKLSNYKRVNNMLIPATIKASWKLDNGDFNYAVFYLNEVAYDLSKNSITV